MKKQKLLWLLRFIGAFITVFIFLNILCFIYFNNAIHRHSSIGATDYVWKPNEFYASAKEGFAFGVIDSNGFNNSFPHKQDQNIDILVMGSSFMEAFQVAQDENTVYLLNKHLQDNGHNEFAYNIGISGHNFLRCASNLEAALNKFKPTQYVIIETDSVTFNASDIDAVLAATYPQIPYQDSGINEILLRFPFLRLISQQLEGFLGVNADDGAANTITEDAAKTMTPSYRDSFIELVHKLADTAKSNSVRLIIVYHPPISFSDDGTMLIDTNPDCLELFKEACRESCIIFADMSDKFLSEYQSQSIVPYGFSNTAIGVGHLNKNGHEMVADILYEIYTQYESGVKG